MNQELEKIKEAKKNGQKIGLVQGSWDLFHIGHLRYLLKAKESCDYLVVAMDSDEKIKKRKGNSRPIIPEEERYDFIQLLGVANSIIIKPANEPKWQLIKEIRPDVLIAIKENYNDTQIEELKNYVGEVKILPRQSETSTSDKIRKVIIASQAEKLKEIDGKVFETVEQTKKRIGYQDSLPEPIPALIQNLYHSTDTKCPVSACCFINGKWYFGSNQVDMNLSPNDIEQRTELYYSTVEHAEINMLKKVGNIEKLNTAVYTTLFPCDKCMKVLIDKGVTEIFYIEDHPDRHWSKRSHELASAHGIKTIQLNFIKSEQKMKPKEIEKELPTYKYIYPPNAREQEQLDIMINMEKENKDPLDAQYINQEIIQRFNYWFITKNKFPYNGIEHQFLIVANYPIYKTEDITEPMWKELQAIWQALQSHYNLPGGALCFRFGDPSYSGASLKRLHAHVIVPKRDEKAKFTVGGRKRLKEGLVIEEENANE